MRRALPIALALAALGAGSAAAATGGASAPATSASTPVTTPTTTYVPPGATTTPGAATTPTVSTPATTAPAGTSPPSATGSESLPPLSGVIKGKRRASNGGLSSAAIAIVALAALLVLACIAWAFARSRAFEPHWLLSLRHAMAEAGFRASATWSEFADWVRLGR